ncbi:transcriptional regulator PpsR [Thermaurantiacus sp.]
MDAQTPSTEPVSFRSPATSVGELSLDTAAQLIALASDVTLVVDKEGRISDLAIGSAELADVGAENWRGRPWAETVHADSRAKVLELLAETRSAPSRWRQLNQITDKGEVPLRWLAIPAGEKGGVIALGRDLSASAKLQQRLVQAQQAVERERLKLRQAEARYRMLFGLANEAMLIVDTATRSIVEGNAAAERLFGKGSVSGKSILQLFQPEDRDALVAFLGAVGASDDVPPVVLHLAGTGAECRLSGLVFREARGAYALIRASPVLLGDSSRAPVEEILEQVPDPFVLANPAGEIAELNSLFLELVGHPRRDDLIGLPLSRFIGRPGVDPGLIMAQLQEDGSVRHFPTVARTRFGELVDVELSAIAAPSAGGVWTGYTLRPVSRQPAEITASSASPRSVEELTQLVGRMSLKDIVRESTDLIERLCIEAALKCADNNRASAAEILGLSRQGLYLKLHRHGLARDTGEDKTPRA